MTMDFSAQRLSYEKGSLIESELPDNPKGLFEQWVKTAVDEQLVEPYAMSIATCGTDGLPSVRTLLMREVTDLKTDVDSNQNNLIQNQTFGIIFYTNYDSAKGEDIEQNPNAQALFFWHSLERQVRVSGKIRKISQEQSTSYFHKRPHDSQVAAWVSEPQSGIVENRDVMETRFKDFKQKYPEGSSVPMPQFWGGYELVVHQLEFWQGRANRMHDRIVYQLIDGQWAKHRLLP